MKTKPTHIETAITVEGAGRFPLDMLRYDGCVPASSADVSAMDRNRERRAVNLRRYSVGPSLPCSARWASFGWSVVEVREVA